MEHLTEKLLTPEEAAERLAVSPKGVKNWLRQGKLRGCKVGRLWRISESALSEFLVSKKDVEVGWLELDLSELGNVEPYDWGVQTAQPGLPVRYVAGQGLIVEEQS